MLSLAIACGDGNNNSTPTPTASSTPARSASPSAAPASGTPRPSSDEPPDRDLLDLARRYFGYDGPRVARTEPYDYAIGDSAEFTLLDLETTESYTVTASVRAITDHAYFFVEDGSPYADSSLDAVTSDFEDILWPTVTGAFGEPWTPGVDGDPRITVLHASLRGAGGYVSGSDEYPVAVAPGSSEREMLYIEDDALSSPGGDYNALVAHELQHLVHAHGDENEDAWVNEGLSEVAWEMAGGSADGVWEYLGRPDTQLNYWPFQEDVGIHYALSELFFGYVLDQFGGRDNARELVDQPRNGIDGTEDYLESFGATFDDVFANFAAACYLDAESGPYSLPGFNGTTTAVDEVNDNSGSGTVSQFGTDYLRFDAGTGGAFRFEGDTEAGLGIPDHDGAFWWSGRGDGMNPRLTREIDLSDVASATLTFDTWYDIEPGWDYAYVSVSEDGGESWTALTGTSTTTDDPVNASYGPGYTGDHDWTTETVDLSDYAGEEVLLRFEYVTDDSTSLTGWAIDNIAIPETGFSDAAGSFDGWTNEGFRDIDGPLPQTYVLQLIRDDGTVQRIPVSSDGTAEVALGAERATIAISGSTRETTDKASYSWSVTP